MKKNSGRFFLIALFVAIAIGIVLFFLKADDKPKVLEILIISDHPLCEEGDKEYPNDLKEFFQVFDSKNGDLYPRLSMKRVDLDDRKTDLFSMDDRDLDESKKDVNAKLSKHTKERPEQIVYNMQGNEEYDWAKDTTGVRTFIISSSKEDGIKYFKNASDVKKKMQALAKEGELFSNRRKRDAVVIVFLSAEASISKESPKKIMGEKDRGAGGVIEKGPEVGGQAVLPEEGTNPPALKILILNDIKYSGTINTISWEVDNENAVDHFGIKIVVDSGEAEDAYRYVNDNIIGTELKLNLGSNWDNVKKRTFQVLLKAYGKDGKELKNVSKTNVTLQCKG